MLLRPLIAKMGKGTAVTLGRASCANIPTKQYNAVAKITAFFRGKNFPQLLLYLFRVCSLGKPQPTANADAVGVAYHTPGCTVDVAQQQIGGFSANTGQL